MTFFILVLSPDLSTVREFLLKQTQLKCLTFETLRGYTKDMFDTTKVLKCYSSWNINLICPCLKVSHVNCP